MKNSKETLSTGTTSLHEAQVIYMKRIEKENLERVQRLKKIKRNNLFTGFGLCSAVLGIYFYSIFSVKQENFLDEIDEKKPI